MNVKRYSELIQLSGFEERFRYLKLNGTVGKATFGFDRYFNQLFYNSVEWKAVRHKVIVRDMGRDLAVEGRELYDRICVHHMNPILIQDIRESSEILLNPEFLICTSDMTHKAIHYGDESLLITMFVERRMNDTCPWKGG
jgi:hypothetical protein